DRGRRRDRKRVRAPPRGPSIAIDGSHAARRNGNTGVSVRVVSSLERSVFYYEEEAPMRALATILALVLTIPAFAADVPEKTQDFVSAATIGNRFEIDTSNLALKYAKGDDVKSFAQKMITDHTKAGEELKAALGKANITPPPDELD